MKGIIISELIGFIERHCSLSIAEQIIYDADLESEGAITSVGNYSHEEAIKLVMSAARILDTPAEDLMRQFGIELFDTLRVSHSQFFDEGAEDTFSFMSKLQSHIHAEVTKLYPGSSPPQITCSRQEEEIHVVYESHRPFAMVAFGLLEGCCAYFDDTLIVQIDTDPQQDPTKAAFTICRTKMH